ncbi:hypothetical protein [Nitrosospira sp. NpAV]|uniref:hypothetical protein n=1 Tax=Nitrosospira sp. NpAV TaxID=58133 RepID=UPI001E36FCB0|nr:hypothetical protein [Nitrosospira sp. NpAV]
MTTKLFLGLNCNFEHCRRITLAHWKKLAAAGDDRITIGREIPPAEILIELKEFLNNSSMQHLWEKLG